MLENWRQIFEWAMAELIMMIMDRKAGYLLARIDIRASFVLATAVCTYLLHW
jgi:hypothetical protein